MHDAMLAVCLLNFINRTPEGHGLKVPAEVFAEHGQALRNVDYAPLVDMLTYPLA